MRVTRRPLILAGSSRPRSVTRDHRNAAAAATSHAAARSLLRADCGHRICADRVTALARTSQDVEANATVGPGETNRVASDYAWESPSSVLRSASDVAPELERIASGSYPARRRSCPARTPQIRSRRRRGDRVGRGDRGRWVRVARCRTIGIARVTAVEAVVELHYQTE